MKFICVGNMDGILNLTIGKVYEGEEKNGKIEVVNDNNYKMTYTKTRFKKMEEKGMFKVGQSVMLKTDITIEDHMNKGLKGVVLGYSDYSGAVGVQFDNDVNGHCCRGLGLDDYCYWISEKDLEPIERDIVKCVNNSNGTMSLIVGKFYEVLNRFGLGEQEFIALINENGERLNYKASRFEGIKVEEGEKEMNREFKVGDKVRIMSKEDMIKKHGADGFGDPEVKFGWLSAMDYLYEQEFTITAISCDKVEGLTKDWTISKDMIEHIEGNKEEIKVTKVLDKNGTELNVDDKVSLGSLKGVVKGFKDNLVIISTEHFTANINASDVAKIDELEEEFYYLEKHMEEAFGIELNQSRFKCFANAIEEDDSILYVDTDILADVRFDYNDIMQLRDYLTSVLDLCEKIKDRQV